MGDVILELLEFIKKEHQQIRENYIEVTKEAMIEIKQLRELLEKVVLAVESLDKTHIAAAQKQKKNRQGQVLNYKVLLLFIPSSCC